MTVTVKLAIAAVLVLVAVPFQIGRSAQGRPITAIRVGDPHGTRVLVVGCIHGTECAGIAITRALEHTPTRADLWIVPDLNPDGHAHGHRQNADGVDLNRNWSSGWQPGGRPWDFQYPGPRPFSEPETRIARNLIDRIKPQVTIWYHQHLNLVWAWGPSTSAGRVYARVAGMRFYHHPWLAGTATNWQNHHLPGTASFTVELTAAGPTSSPGRARARRTGLTRWGVLVREWLTYRVEAGTIADVISEQDVVRVVDAARPLQPAVGVYVEEDFVMNLLETVIDYQLHTTAVVRALQRFRDTCWQEVRTLDDLERLIAAYPDDQPGNTALAQHLWGYNLWTRAHQLRGLIAYFRSISVANEEQLRTWARSSTFKGDFEGKVKGLGRAVYQWLVMRQGVDTVKPDVHVRRFADAAVGRSLSDADVVEVVVAAARRLGMKAFELDWRIWEASRARVSD